LKRFQALPPLLAAQLTQLHDKRRLGGIRL
jgi:hypothetical protein